MNQPANNSDCLPHSAENKYAHDLSVLAIDQLDAVSPELAMLSTSIVEMLKQQELVNGEALAAAWLYYAEITEEYVDSFEDTPQAEAARTKAQITAIVHKASLFDRAGNLQRYLEELDSAEVYAANAGFDDVSQVLLTEIRQKVEQLPFSSEMVLLKLKGTIDDESRNFLYDMLRDGDDVEDIVSAAYGMILEQGNDPDEILRSLGVTE